MLNPRPTSPSLPLFPPPLLPCLSFCPLLGPPALSLSSHLPPFPKFLFSPHLPLPPLPLSSSPPNPPTTPPLPFQHLFPSLAVLNARPPFFSSVHFDSPPLTRSACGWTLTSPHLCFLLESPATRNDQTSQRTSVVDTPTEPVRAHSGYHTLAVHFAPRLRRFGLIALARIH